MNQELACAILTRFGHEVDVAGDGAKAIKAVKRKAYELILMDVQMPKLDGISATKLIRAMEGPIANIPIIALTANVLPEQVRQYRQAGVSDHVAKPIKQPICSARSSGSWKWCRKALMRSNSTTRRSRRCETSCRQTAFASISIFFDQELQSAFAGSGNTDLEEAAHKMVSQAGMLGFERLAGLCRELEQAQSPTGAAQLDELRSAAEAARKAGFAVGRGGCGRRGTRLVKGIRKSPPGSLRAGSSELKAN